MAKIKSYGFKESVKNTSNNKFDFDNFVYINKRYLRPNYSDIIFVSAILGCLPNLIGAFMFSLLPMTRTLKLDLYKGRIIILISSFTVFCILTYEEFFPYLTASKTFDYFDIVASAIGSFLAFIYYYFLSKKK